MPQPQEIPSRAQVVIIGGGIVGCSVAYHLVELGWKDVVLLERKQLTCGTTWHAAGLVGQLRATHNLTRLAQYTAELYAGLERKTGQATGFRRTGSLSVAATEARLEELMRGASMARCFGLEVEVITAQRANELWPLMLTDDLVGAVYLPKDGRTNPIDTTQALAKSARAGGAQIIEHTKVTDILHARGRVNGVRTERGDVQSEYVVNCAGMWSREIGRLCGVSIPLQAAEHFYVVTEPIAGLGADIPVLRDPDNANYFKDDAGKLLVGWFEPVARPWGHGGIPEEFSFDQLPVDLEHIEPQLEKAMCRVPVLAEHGLQVTFNGPESFTPDDRYLLGEAPELRNFFVAAGFNSIGIQSAGGAGRVLAEWIAHGHPPMDLWDVDLRRMMPFQGNARYLHDRTVESLGLLYAMHWPFRQVETARGVRRSALHDRLAALGACFGEVAGWERPNWYAPPGVEPVYEYSYGRQNWFEHSAAEHRATREAVALFDQSSFAKFLVQGPDAEAVLERICANRIAGIPVGKIVYTQWLNERGGIEADLTVTRTGDLEFLMITSAACQTRDFAWLKSHIGSARACATNVTSGYAVLGLMGPRSRALLSELTAADLSNEGFPFATSQEIELGYAIVRASRITYVGELGWELYVPTEFVQNVFDTLAEAGRPHGLRLAGYHALNSLRMEAAYRHWGHDITDEDTPFQAGLGFAVAFENRDFIGREALLRRRGSIPKRRLIQFAMSDPDAMLYHNEPVWRDGRLVGRITSGMYGHTVRRALGMGYVEAEEGVTSDFVASGRFDIEIACRRVPAVVSLQAFYDPTHARVRDARPLPSVAA